MLNWQKAEPEKDVYYLILKVFWMHTCVYEEDLKRHYLQFKQTL